MREVGFHPFAQENLERMVAEGVTCCAASIGAYLRPRVERRDEPSGFAARKCLRQKKGTAVNFTF